MALGQSQMNRAKKSHSVYGHYTFIDTWMPSKKGLSYTYIEDSSVSWDLSWDHGSLGLGWFLSDISKIEEDRITLLRTSYSERNSFYFTYGFNYYNLNANIGSNLISKIVGNQNIASLDVIQIKSLGASFGIGNRWQFEDWVVGVNWISLHIPVIALKSNNKFLDYATDQDDRDSIEDAINIIKRIPTFTVLKIQVGYSF